MFTLEQRRKYVENCLLSCLGKVESFPPVIHEAMHYSVFNGGKRIRPLMVFEGARLAGGEPCRVEMTACAMELIHTYSLVHDDLPAMDNDDLRRGKPTCHCVYGEDIAILTGDALLTAAFELIAKNAQVEGIKASNVIKVIEMVAQAVGSRGMIGGQVLDLHAEGEKIDYEELKVLHGLKTGRLFQASLLAGAVLSGIDEDKIMALEVYAYNFGLAFQITDDILDVSGQEDLLGKPVGSDQKNHKITYPSLLGIEKSYQLAAESVELCLQSLDIFGSEGDFLRSLAQFVLHRKA